MDSMASAAQACQPPRTRRFSDAEPPIITSQTTQLLADIVFDLPPLANANG